MENKTVKCGKLNISNSNPFTLIAGPCQLENEKHALDVAAELKKITGKLGVGLIYKSPRAQHKQMKIFIEGLLAVCEGQALDKEFETQQSVSLEDYIQMIDLKTGHMIALCMQLGAMVATDAQDTISKMKSVGMCIGRAFQVQVQMIGGGIP